MRRHNGRTQEKEPATMVELLVAGLLRLTLWRSYLSKKDYRPDMS
jgi:hypothetical protein